MTDSHTTVEDPLWGSCRGTVSARSEKPTSNVSNNVHRCCAAHIYVLVYLSSGQIRTEAPWRNSHVSTTAFTKERSSSIQTWANLHTRNKNNRHTLWSLIAQYCAAVFCMFLWCTLLGTIAFGLYDVWWVMYFSVYVCKPLMLWLCQAATVKYLLADYLLYMWLFGNITQMKLALCDVFRVHVVIHYPALIATVMDHSES